MGNEENYLEINRKSWNNRVDAHVRSEFYGVDAFIQGGNALKEIELGFLGDVTGKRILHLQCHFGQDTISLARMGAYVTGVDLSDVAIAKAKELASATGAAASFVCCDIYDLPQHLQTPFDIIFTSYGTIGWLPDLDKWAQIISRFLKKDGKFIFAEFHPVIWMYDDAMREIKYKYFNSGPIVESETGTYADRTADITQDYVMWNHGIGEVLTALLKAGLMITRFEEFDYSPYNFMQNMVETSPGKFHVQHIGDKIPMVYALSAEKLKDNSL